MWVKWALIGFVGLLVVNSYDHLTSNRWRGDLNFPCATQAQPRKLCVVTPAQQQAREDSMNALADNEEARDNLRGNRR